MSRALPEYTRKLIHRLFWKLEVAQAYSLESGRERKFPINRIYSKLGNVDLTCLAPETHQDGHDVWYWTPTETTPEIVWPVDKSMAQKLTDPDLGWPEGTIQFLRIKSIGTKRARELRAIRFGRIMVEKRICWLLPDNTAYYLEEPLLWMNDKWISVRNTPSRGDAIPQFMKADAAGAVGHDPHHATSMLMSAAFRDRYERQAIITNKHGFSIMMAMSVPTAQAFFKLRDVPPEKQRRSALRNWVSSHIRHISDEKQTVVRDYLRNRIEFDWAGFKCEYRPSEYDEEVNKKLAEEKTK